VKFSKRALRELRRQFRRKRKLRAVVSARASARNGSAWTTRRAVRLRR
jgi:hypothetical protein